MQRLYLDVFKEHFINHRQMLWVVGPRQAGKTTAAQTMDSVIENVHYFTWDNPTDRQSILDGSEKIAQIIGISVLRKTKPLVIFDEIHKYPEWRMFLKGFYDSYPDKAHILATGSASFNVFSRGGDSLMGRYFPFRFHPLSVAELLDQSTSQHDLRAFPQPLADNEFQALWQYGGFPDPFLKRDEKFYYRWRKLRIHQLLQEDIRDLTKIHDVARMELLIELLNQQVGQLINYQSLAKKIRVTDQTIRHWLEILRAMYYCFEIKPWSKNIAHSLLKTPKYYLWDWSQCSDNGTRAENFIASHLLKAIHFWQDIGLGDYGLYYLRDKQQHEVDFIVTKNDKPWFLVEVKYHKQTTVSPTLYYFQKQLNAAYALQVVIDMAYVDQNCFQGAEPLIVPAKTFLSQLV
jgi:uncharacterized protein